MKKTLLKWSFLALVSGTSFFPLQTAVAQAPVFTNDAVVTPATGFPYFAVNSAATGQGVTVDPDGKVWTLSNQKGIVVYNRDGNVYKFPATQTKLEYTAGTNSVPEHISKVKFTGLDLLLNGTSGNNGGNRGIRRAQDGNILFVTNNSYIVKLNYKTGEPMAYYNTGVSVGAPSDDKNGNIFVTSVTGNASWIVKPVAGQELMQAVKENFTLSDRPTGSVSRNATITPDGRTIYVPYSDKEGLINRYTSTDGLNWTLAGNVDLQGQFSNAVYAASNNRLYYVTYPTPNGPSFRFGMNSVGVPSQSWNTMLPDEFGSAADIRGIDLTPGQDTAYFVSGTNGRIYRFIAAAGSVLGAKSEVLAKTVRAYPVPATNTLFLDMPATLSKSTTILVMELSGKRVPVQQTVKGNQIALDLGGVRAGTYLVVIHTPEGRIVRRVVKQ